MPGVAAHARRFRVAVLRDRIDAQHLRRVALRTHRSRVALEQVLVRRFVGHMAHQAGADRDRAVHVAVLVGHLRVAIEAHPDIDPAHREALPVTGRALALQVGRVRRIGGARADRRGIPRRREDRQRVRVGHPVEKEAQQLVVALHRAARPPERAAEHRHAEQFEPNPAEQVRVLPPPVGQRLSSESAAPWFPGSCCPSSTDCSTVNCSLRPTPAAAPEVLCSCATVHPSCRLPSA